MNLLTLPTDNLYKFLALSGLILFLFFNFYPHYLRNEIMEEMTTIETESGELKLEVKLLEERQEELIDEIEEVNDKILKYQIEDQLDNKINIENLKRQLQDSNYREYLEFVYNHKDDLFPEIELQKQILEKRNEIKKIRQEIELNSHRILRKLEIIEEKNEQMIKSIWMWAIGSCIGLIMMLLGFRLWYTKSQKPMDNKLVREINEHNTY